MPDERGVWLLLNLRRAGAITEIEESLLVERESNLAGAIIFLRENPDFDENAYHPPSGNPEWNAPLGEQHIFRSKDGWWK